MSFPKLFRRLFENDGAGPKLLGSIMPYSLSDALDGTRRAGDGVGASEWALGQAAAAAAVANARADSAGQAAAAAQATADAALPQADYDAGAWSRARAIAFIHSSGNIVSGENVISSTRTAVGKYTVTVAPGVLVEGIHPVAIAAVSASGVDAAPAQVNVGTSKSPTFYVNIGNKSGTYMDMHFSFAVFQPSVEVDNE